MASLIEETGYSYSGIADIVLNDSERAKELLISINDEYRIAKTREEQLQRELEAAQTNRAYLVSSFLYFMEAHKSDSLVFESDNEIVIIERLSESKIDYEAYEKTQFNNQ